MASGVARGAALGQASRTLGGRVLGSSWRHVPSLLPLMWEQLNQRFPKYHPCLWAGNQLLRFISIKTVTFTISPKWLQRLPMDSFQPSATKTILNQDYTFSSAVPSSPAFRGVNPYNSNSVFSQLKDLTENVAPNYRIINSVWIDPFRELLSFPIHLPCIGGIHVIKLPFVLLLLVCLSLQGGLSKEPGRVRGKLFSLPQ